MATDQPAGTIPQELIDVVIEFVASSNNIATLSNISLASWPCFFRSRRHLFNNVPIRCDRLSSLIRDLENPCSLFRPDSIRGLRLFDTSVRGIGKPPDEQFRSDLVTLTKLLTSVQYLSIEGGSSNLFRSEFLYSAIGAWKETLTHVVLFCIGRDPKRIMQDILPNIVTLPYLWHLGFNSNRYDKDGLRLLKSQLQDLPLPTSLRSLQLLGILSDFSPFFSLVEALPPLQVEHITTSSIHDQTAIAKVYSILGPNLRSARFTCSLLDDGSLFANPYVRHLTLAAVGSERSIIPDPVEPDIPPYLKKCLLSLSSPSPLVTLTLLGHYDFKVFNWPALISTLSQDRFPCLEVLCIVFHRKGKEGREFISDHFRDAPYLKQRLRFFSPNKQWPRASMQAIPWPLCHDDPQVGYLQPEPFISHNVVDEDSHESKLKSKPYDHSY